MKLLFRSYRKGPQTIPTAQAAEASLGIKIFLIPHILATLDTEIPPAPPPAMRVKSLGSEPCREQIVKIELAIN